MSKARTFTARERAYLSSLDAVESVDGSSRVHYADWFRDECMRRYRAGEKPTALFREAGLDPKLIGYKRIERAFARWRYMDRTPTSRETSEALPAFKPAATASDPRDKLISEQALRIQQLEAEIRELKQA